MNNNLLLSKSVATSNKSLAKIISIRPVIEKRRRIEAEVAKVKKGEVTILFYTEPIFKAKKYEFF